MSKPFAERVVLPIATRGAVLAALGLTVVACGSSTPRQAEVERAPAVVAPSVARIEAPAPAEAVPQPERRRERRGDRAAQESMDAALAPDAVPDAAAVAYERALAAMRAEDWLGAELELEQLTHDYPAFPGPYVNLAIVYLRDGRGDDARAALDRALKIEPTHAAANTQLGILLREQGEFAEAEQAYRRALESEPKHSLAHYNLGVLLDVYLRRPAEAADHYEAYQSGLAAPDETVGRWIIDLRRRAGNADATSVAQEGTTQ